MAWATRPPLSDPEMLPLELAADVVKAAGAAEKETAGAAEEAAAAADVTIGEGVKTMAGVVVVGVAMTVGVTLEPPSMPPETGRPKEAQPDEYSI